MPLSTEKLRFRIYLIIFLTVLVVGTFGYMLTEDLTLVDAFYFTIVTIATVGYGDIAPVTTAGKILDVVLIVAGVGTFVGLVANATDSFVLHRESQDRRQKLQMLIGLFFSEAGTELLRMFVGADRDPKTLKQIVAVSTDWQPDDYRQVTGQMQTRQSHVVGERIDLPRLQQFLNGHRELLIRLLESPYVMEHETFTDLLIATLHLKEELEHRPGFEALPDSDLQHLEGDINRIYRVLTTQWLAYMQHLQTDYPFLFSLAMRTNPFNPLANAVVKA